MKKFKVKIPKKLADVFVDYAFVNGIQVMLSWAEDADMFGFGEQQIVAVCGVAEDKAEAVKTSDWKQYLIN